MREQTMQISQPALDGIKRAAEMAQQLECMGLLASEPTSDLITAAYQLPAEAGTAHAVASPQHLSRAAEELRSSGLIPRGLWHSHGGSSVFHSGTDDKTIRRFLPAMAGWSSRSPRSEPTPPMLTGRDDALLPDGEGNWLRFSLLGPPISGIDAHETAAWEGQTTSFVDREGAPEAVIRGNELLLDSAGVRLSLGLPEGSSLIFQKEDRAETRVSRLFSIVVNNKGDICAACLAVFDLCGETVLELQDCEIEVSSTPNGRESLLEDLIRT